MKKALALLLVLVMALGMSTTAFALDWTKNGTGAGYEGFDGLGTGGFKEADTEPDDKVWIYIDPTQFGHQLGDGTPLTNTTKKDTTTSSDGYTRKDLGSKLTIRTKISKGSSAIDEIKIDYDTVANGNDTQKVAYVYVHFTEFFKNNNIDGMDFNFTVYPVVDGKAWSDRGIEFDGTITNPNTEVYSDNDLVDLFDGQIAYVKEYVRKIEYNLGEGVSVWGKGIKNAKYWGVANQDPTDAQDELMTKYDIDTLYNLDHIGLASVADYVILNDADPAAYVYDKNMKYLARGKDKLAFSETYYLADKMLDVDSDEEEEEPEDVDPTDDPVAPPDLGGDGYPENVNDNPGTGK